MPVTTRDVKSLSAEGEAKLKGDITLSEGANITLTQSGQDIEIAASGGSGSPGGSDTQIQFNDGGSFGGDSALLWDKTNNWMAIGATTPVAPLTFYQTGGNSGIVFQRNSSTQRGKIFLGDGTGGFAGDELYYSALNSTHHFLAGTSGTTEIAQLDSAGMRLLATSTGVSGSLTIGPIANAARAQFTKQDNNSTYQAEFGISAADYIFTGIALNDMYFLNSANKAIHFLTGPLGLPILTFTGGSAAVFNDLGGDIDVRIEGDTDANLFFSDASTDRIGIGISSPSAKFDINSDILRLRTSKTPASSSASGNQGDICWDADYIYVATATDTWKRSALATW